MVLFLLPTSDNNTLFLFLINLSSNPNKATILIIKNGFTYGRLPVQQPPVTSHSILTALGKRFVEPRIGLVSGLWFGTLLDPSFRVLPQADFRY